MSLHRLLLLVCLASTVEALPYVSIAKVTADPTGVCSNAAVVQMNYTNGDLSACIAGHWSIITGGGGGTGLQPPNTGTNVLLLFQSGYQTTAASASDVINTISSTFNQPNSIVTLGANQQLRTSQFPAFTGDVTSAGATTALTLPNIVSAGTWPKVTFNAKGQVTGGSALASGDLPSVAIVSSSTYANPSWLVQLDSSKLINPIPANLIPASSAGNLGGIYDHDCGSDFVQKIVAGVATCAAGGGGGGGGGSVTSVALTMPSPFSVSGSPVTGAGTLAVSIPSQAQNSFYAGPASGGAGAATFRAVTSADVPPINLAGTGNGGVTGLLPASSISGTLTASLNGLTAATGTNSINNAANTQTWNWSLPGSNNIGLKITENSASTGTGTALASLQTVATSTASPLCVYSQGASNGWCTDTSGNIVAKGTGGVDAAAIGKGTVNVARLPTLALQTYLEAAGVAQNIPYAVFDLPGTNTPLPQVYGTSYPFATLDYADSANSFAFVRLVLPSGTQTLDADLYWFVNGVNQTAKFTIASVCIASGSDELNPTFNSNQTLTSTSGPTINTLTAVTQTGVTFTGCTGGAEMILKIGRDVTDSSTNTISLRGIRLTAHVTPSS